MVLDRAESKCWLCESGLAVINCGGRMICEDCVPNIMKLFEPEYGEKIKKEMEMKGAKTIKLKRFTLKKGE